MSEDNAGDTSGSRLFKVALIGSGGRSVSYARAFVQSGKVDIVAVADPDANHRKTMAALSGLSETDEYRSGRVVEFDDWRRLLDSCEELDGAVVCTPNHLHAGPAVACLERGLPIACEKPLATNMGDCELIIDAVRKFDGRVLVGFVLRSSPFYATIHRLIREGEIGSILSIQADELPGLTVTSIMNRSPWRRYRETGGGAMLEKSCHDLDILNWMTGSRPLSLTSYGSRRLFTPNPNLPPTCGGCPVAESCAYYRRPEKSDHEDQGEQVLHSFLREEECCIYNVEKDIFDTQSVNIEYENGTLVTFMLAFGCSGPRAGRNFHAVGTAGRIWGNLHNNTVHLYRNTDGETEEFDTSGDGTGHGGGDRLHALELLRMMKEPEYTPDQDAVAGYLSAAMSFATDLSVYERRIIGFEYDNHRIKLV